MSHRRVFCRNTVFDAGGVSLTDVTNKRKIDNTTELDGYWDAEVKNNRKPV